VIHTHQWWSFPLRRKLCAYPHNGCIYYTDFHCWLTVLQHAFFSFLLRQDRTVGIINVLQAGCPRNCGSIPGMIKKFLSSSKYLECFWGPPTLLFSKYQCTFLSMCSMELTTHLHLQPRLRTSRTIPLLT